jgi:hypothetical protein
MQAYNKRWEQAPIGSEQLKQWMDQNKLHFLGQQIFACD